MNSFIRYCPSCDKEISYKSKFGYDEAIKRNSKCLSCAHGGNAYLYFSGLIRNCPNCKKEITYKSENVCTKANKNNSKCKSCSKIKIITIPIRICCCGKEIFYKTIKGYKNAVIKNSKCLSCSHSVDAKIKMSKNQTGVNNSFFGKKHSDEAKHKLRLHHIKQIEERYGQIMPNYNPKACQYFNKLMEEKNIFIRHAENGGEYYISELGYWVDGYDEINNVVYEFDEKHHFDVFGNLKNKDIRRQKEIEEFLNCKFIRIKFNVPKSIN
jgi:hypothetical protein